MTISSGATAPNPVLAYRAPANSQTAQDDDALIRQRFAGMLGLNPDQLTSPPTDSVSLSPKAKEVSAPRQEAAATDTILPSGTPVPPPIPTPLTRDDPGPTISAGTVIDGMVSAGPTSPGLASMTGIVPEATGTHLIAVATDAQKFNYDPIAMIRDRLSKLGVNPGNLQLERWVDTINGPGGQRVNQYVRGTIGGVSENFAVERVLQNPDITAVEIQGLLNRAA